jgi:hypothetical protein
MKRGLIAPPPEPGERLPPLHERLAWFFGLALAAAFTTAGVAYLLKALLR